MKPLLGDDGLEAIRELRGARTLYAFDFDGTLCPIVRHPDRARLGERMAGLLRALSEVAPVAIISGRGLADLRGRCQEGPWHLIGNHGAEGLPSCEAPLSAAAACERWLRTLCLSDTGARWNSSGMRVESKGISLSLHYRNCDNHSMARRELLALVARLDPPPRVVRGKCVLNLVPAESPHKGHALGQLISDLGCERALFVGDDVTDEDVFALPDPRILGVRVERRKGSRAGFYLKDQGEVERLIEEILLTSP